MLRVGLTGSSGVLGSRLIDEFSRRGITVSSFEGDIREVNQVSSWVNESKCDLYIHAAAVVPVSSVQKDLGNAISVNVVGTAILAYEVEKIGSRFVYVSSAHVYKPNLNLIDENAFCSPSSNYGLTKLQGEEWVSRLCTNTLIVRVFSLFDENQDLSFLVPGLVQKIKNAGQGQVIQLGGFSSKRDFASAKYYAKVIAILSTCPVNGIVNVGTGEALEVGQIAKRIATTLRRDDLIFEGFDSDTYDSIVSDTSFLRSVVPALPSFELDSELKVFET